MERKTSSSSLPLMLERLDGYGVGGLRSPVRGEEVAERIMRGSPDQCDLISFLPRSQSKAIVDPMDMSKLTTHEDLAAFVEDFDMRKFGIAYGCRVALILPNGPHLAVCLICTVSRWCAAPINSIGPAHEIQSELESTKAQVVIILRGRANNDAVISAATALGLGVLELIPNPLKSGLFTLEMLILVPVSASAATHTVANTVPGFKAYSHPETVLLLHTSGTSGNKKCVPYSLDMILTGVGCIISSWDLGPFDICLNMMPLFHIGGIMRNVLSPILSGGAVITCNAFDAALFWNILATHRFTWYYAAPTMHHAILKASEDVPKPLPIDTVRYIANAAGGLLPVLAQSLKDTFSNAIILTSYGMTECMPISSPPQNYALDPIGTSGKAVGPDILICDEEHTTIEPIGKVGNILVRGPPCFGGYENNQSSNDQSFFRFRDLDGWFDTGDTGYLNSNGYLFIQGRSKEIINKGGETISPFEIEEQVQQHPYVGETLAFSTPHSLYQETVGCVIVSRPGMPRVDLAGIHEFLESRLSRAKWPQMIVFMEALPKNQAGKILRIKFAERARIPEINDKTPPSQCLYEADCPAVGTPLLASITLRPVEINVYETEVFISSIPGVCECKVIKLGSSFQEKVVAFVVPSTLLAAEIMEACRERLAGYLLPAIVIPVECLASKVISNDSTPSPFDDDQDILIDTENTRVIDYEALELEAIEVLSAMTVAPRDEMESQVEEIWRKQLGITDSVLSVKNNFFALGGDSLKAGQVVNAMKTKFGISSLSVQDLLNAATIEDMSSTLSSKLQGSTTKKSGSSPDLKTRLSRSSLSSAKLFESSSSSKAQGPSDEELKDIDIGFKDERLIGTDANQDNHNKNSNSSFIAMLIQLLPLVVFYPMRKISVWFLISYPWVIFMNAGMDRFFALVLAICTGRLLLAIFSPLAAIAMKWIIIGRYRSGRYPLWGSMYLRWWLVEQILDICGKGVFSSDMPFIGSYLVKTYYTMLGVKIGKNVKISGSAKLGQFDLLEIGDDVCIDSALIRPFSLEADHFYLLPIKIGDNCCICLKSSIAAGSELDPGTCIGPLSSTHEMHDANPKYRKYCRQTFPSPPLSLILFPGVPLIFLVLLTAYIPWAYGLNLMVNSAVEEGWYTGAITTVAEAFYWWVTPQRIVWYFVLHMVRDSIVPILKLAMIILIKRFFLNKSEPGDLENRNDPWNLFNYWLMSKFLPDGKLGGVLHLIGSHYEVVSWVYRLLGAKIGKRVYWPGSGIDIVEFDLLEVGDDVVFGSRSVVMTSSSERSARVIFESGVMVADRCVVLPGVRLKRLSVIGSGTLAPENFEAEVGAVWVGSSGGQPINAAPSNPSLLKADTMTPFGKAFYEGKADYFVITLPFVIAYNFLWDLLCSVLSNCPTVISVYIVFYIWSGQIIANESLMMLYLYILLIFAPFNFCIGLLSMSIDIAGKWLVMGRREKGSYQWDLSSYCQRWQIYLTIKRINDLYLNMIQGSVYLCWYFRALGANIGDEVCLYPNGGDPMMTEPELVTIDSYSSVDDASIIAHINTRGIFKLNPLRIGKHCVLKSNCRLLSGASMEDYSILLEHTLVLSGEVVSEKSVWQGWPNEVLLSLEEYREHLSALLNHCKDMEDNASLSSIVTYNFPPLSKQGSRIISKRISYDNDIPNDPLKFESLSENQSLLELSTRSSYDTLEINEEPKRVLKMIRKASDKTIEDNQYVVCLRGFFCSDIQDEDNAV